MPTGNRTVVHKLRIERSFSVSKMNPFLPLWYFLVNHSKEMFTIIELFYL